MRRLIGNIVFILMLLAVPAVVAAQLMSEENVTQMPENLTDEVSGNVTVNMTVVDVIVGDENLTTLATAVVTANLTEALQTGGPYTIFAPNNTAFEALGNETVADLLNNTEELTRVLTYHVVEGNYTAADLLNATEGGNETTLLTLAGENLTLNQTEEGMLMVDNATVIVADLNASNGVVHVIDAVLIPPSPENMTEVTPEAEVTPA